MAKPSKNVTQCFLSAFRKKKSTLPANLFIVYLVQGTNIIGGLCPAGAFSGSWNLVQGIEEIHAKSKLNSELRYAYR